MTRLFKHRLAAAAAFILLALFGGVAIDRSAHDTARSAGRASALIVYKGQFAACLRGNALRHEINRRVSAQNAQRDVTIELLRAARSARIANFHETHHRSDLKAAHRYSQLLRQERTVRFGNVTIVNCQTAVPKP